MATNLQISVNGRVHPVEAAPDTPLLYVLRDELKLNGPKFGCGLAQCGACTVHLGADAVRSCVTPVSAVGARPVTTIEGLGTPETPHRVQKAFIDEQAPVGAGEPATCPILAAIANAVFDATGARLRTVPFTPDRVKAALERS